MSDPAPHSATSETTRLLAWALFDFRVLLAPHIGRESAVAPEVRAAAELAYALHNLALAAMDGTPISQAAFSEALSRAELASGEPFLARYKRSVEGGV